MALIMDVLGVLCMAPLASSLHGDVQLSEDALGLAESSGHGGPVWQKLDNDQDMLYTLKMKLGGQDVRAIPDSGSFDLLAFSTECAICGLKHGYDSSKSASFSTTHFENEQDFGSGAAKSVESFDRALVGGFLSENQTFWKVTEADQGFAGITFGAILGVGPPQSSLTVAEQSAKEAEKEVKSLADQGQDVSALLPIVDQLQAAVDHARRHVQFIKAAQIRSFSVCLRPGNGRPGELIWNDTAVEEHEDVFFKVNPVSSPRTMYWSAVLTDAKLAGDHSFLGCQNKKCDGVIDTGTSLIVMPSAVYDTLAQRLDTLLENDPSCSNLNDLPDLEFKLDGKHMSVPPEAYVGDVEGMLPDFLRDHMPHMWGRQQKMRDGGNATAADMVPSFCGLLAMKMDDASDVGPYWVLGIPFFKKYYTNFELSKDNMQAGVLHFAEKTDACMPVKGAVLTLEPASMPSRMKVDASKLRAPRHPSATRTLHTRTIVG